MNPLRLLGYFRDPGRDAECDCYVCPGHERVTEWAAHVSSWFKAMLTAGWRVEAVQADGMAPRRRQIVTITLRPPEGEA